MSTRGASGAGAGRHRAPNYTPRHASPEPPVTAPKPKVRSAPQGDTATSSPARTSRAPKSSGEPTPRSRTVPEASPGSGIGGSAAGFILGLLAWGWVFMPLISGGPTRAKQVLKAKFMNQTPNGAWLP